MNPILMCTSSFQNNDDGDSQSEAKRSNETVGAEKSQPASEIVESSRGLIEQVVFCLLNIIQIFTTLT